MKKSFLVALVAVFFVLLFVSPKPSCAAPAKPIELKFSVFISLQHQTYTDVYAPFGKELEEKTNGRVKVVFYPSETLGKAKDHYDMAARGITDIAMFVHGYTPGRFPLTGVMELPIGVPSAEIGSRALWELYQKYLKQEYPGVKLLEVMTQDPGQVHMNKKSVKTLEDLKGLRIRSTGPQQMALVRAWGGSPLTIPVPELYDALQKGMADGALLNVNAVRDFKLGDVLRYHTMVNCYVMTAGIVMNLNTWNSLPPDIQKIIDEVAGVRIAVHHAVQCDKNARLGIDEAKKAKAQIYELPPEERKIWMDKAKPVCDAWIADMEKKGLPGKKVFEEAVSLVEKYSKQ